MKKDNMIECRCGGHMIELFADMFDKYGTIDMLFWYLQGGEKNSLWYRIKMAWNVLLGNKVYIYDVVLDKEEIVNLRNKLNDIVN